jgi:integrase
MPRQTKGVQLYLRPARRPGGLRYFSILDPDAEPREIRLGIGEGDRAAAERALAAYLEKKHKRHFGGGDPAEVLVADCLLEYADDLETRGAGGGNVPGSLVHLDEFWDGKVVAQVTPQECQKYIPWRCAKGNKMKRDGRPLKRSSARNDLVLLKSALRFCHANQKLAVAPAIKLPEPAQPRPRCLTRPEAARLLAAALGWQFEFRDGRWVPARRNRKRINRPLARFILASLYTGTRKDRTERLMWLENLLGGWIDVERRVLHRKAKGEPDTKKRAPFVPLGDRLLAHLRRWHQLDDGRGYVIAGPRGRRLKNIVNGFERIARDAGLNYDGQPEDKRVVPHTLRHTCVSLLLADGWSCKQVGDFVGMTEAMVQKVYGHPIEEVQQAVANARFGKRLCGAEVRAAGLSHTMRTKRAERA